MEFVWEYKWHKKKRKKEEFVTRGYVLSVWDDDTDAMRGHKTKMPSLTPRIYIWLTGNMMEGKDD